MGGRGKGGGYKGGGKGFGGFGFGSSKGSGSGKGGCGVGSFQIVPSDPVLEAPPLYPRAPMQDVPRATELRGAQDEDLITYHRQLIHFWKTSPYYQPEAGPKRRFRLKQLNRDADEQMAAIVEHGGLGPEYFPAELQTRSLLKLKGKTSQRDIFDALKRMEGKERKVGEKSSKASKSKEGEIDEDGVHDEDDEEDDDMFGADNDLTGVVDVEDGMGDDFDDDAGRGEGGEAE
eukprot:TRINITY_DN49144_c0_g1_i1.p1 TRINITY_DN49144_c0_g1~~TRINITY_DN49144_c0_g1_i1.p1  ORF type:complete len:232 (+),score=62.52 TRINITY_DN49144_c0_g1_i1:52-747(+)